MAYTRFKGVLLEGLMEAPIRYNSKETPFRTVPVMVTYPDGSQGECDATLFENSRLKHEDKLAVGSTVELLVQVGGDYDGYAQVGLPGRRRAETQKAVSTFEREVTVNTTTEEFITEDAG